MLIDWFTVAAQIVNFLVLVALAEALPVWTLIRAIDAREKRIADAIGGSRPKNRKPNGRCEQTQIWRRNSSRSNASA